MRYIYILKGDIRAYFEKQISTQFTRIHCRFLAIVFYD